MDRKGIISVVLAVLVLLVWQVKFAPKYLPPPGAEASPSPTAAAGPDASAMPAPGPAASVAALSGTTAAPEEHVAEKIQEATGPAARYEFTNLGGGIERASLLNYPAESGSDVYLNEFGTVPIGAISEQPGVGSALPYTVTVDGATVVCTRTQPDGLVITKRFHLPESTSEANGYRLMMDVTFANQGAKAVQSPGYYLYVGSAAPIHQRDLAMYTGFDWYGMGKSNHIDVSWFNAGKIPLVGMETHPARPVYTMQADKIGWAAVHSQFFTIVAAPENGAAGVGVWAHRFPVQRDGTEVQAIEGGLQMAAFNLQPGQNTTQSFEIYAGPKIFSVLKGLKDGQEKILNFGIFSLVSVFLLNSMNFLHSFVGSYALAIIILTLCIRGVLWPIQNRATASMRQMQELQPRMAELKEKYANDPAKMNQEVMRLYKEYNVNPLAGCIPMALQLPIFMGFYRMLGTAIELRNSKFLWVHDLSQPDTVFHLSGYPINILPLCMAATMMVQMSLTPKSGDQAQQRMFMFVPLIFVAFCYNFASALALYYTVQNVFSIAQLYVTRSRTAPAPLKLKPAKRKPGR